MKISNHLHHSKFFDVAFRFAKPPHFNFLQAAFFCVYGLKEIILDTPRRHFRPNPAQGFVSRTCQAVSHFFIECQRQFFAGQFSIIHGSLFFTAGVACALSGLQAMHKLPTGISPHLLQGLNIGFFLAACAHALHHNVDVYRNSVDGSDGKKTALLGIISSFNYLLWGAMFLFGAPTALALFFCGIGLSSGALKILFEILQNI